MSGSQAPAPGTGRCRCWLHFTTNFFGGLLFSLKIARSDTQERSYCNSVDSGKGTGRCRVYLSKEETLMPERYDERIVETAVQARQGVTGHNVRYVLAFGTCGVIAAFVIIYFLFFR